MLTGFSHLMIFVKNMDRAVGFYISKLGFTVNYQAGEHYASLQNSDWNFRLDLHLTDDDSFIGRGPQPYFICDDIHALVHEFKTKNIEINEPRCEGESPWFSGFKDSEGNLLGIEEKR